MINPTLYWRPLVLLETELCYGLIIGSMVASRPLAHHMMWAADLISNAVHNGTRYSLRTMEWGLFWRLNLRRSKVNWLLGEMKTWSVIHFTEHLLYSEVSHGTPRGRILLRYISCIIIKQVVANVVKLALLHFFLMPVIMGYHIFVFLEDNKEALYKVGKQTKTNFLLGILPSAV